MNQCGCRVMILTPMLLFKVHSPLNLKHPHDVVIFMRQDGRVNYLKKLEVCSTCINMPLSEL